MKTLSQITLHILSDRFTVYRLDIDGLTHTHEYIEAAYPLAVLPAFEARLLDEGYQKHPKRCPDIVWYQRIVIDPPPSRQAVSQKHWNVIHKALRRVRRAE